ncbi:MAG: hypothetical protein CL920_28945 [Deltaproteobacteria bacterium]|nr:hypothetical protein [Deltaproteobacteria bacterium]MBK04294.1 hypothetical protein [Deltaproteobacteria bacterium]MBU52737.1 hypothetical protein [Deltaproteobacteria bacterium]
MFERQKEPMPPRLQRLQQLWNTWSEQAHLTDTTAIKHFLGLAALTLSTSVPSTTSSLHQQLEDWLSPAHTHTHFLRSLHTHWDIYQENPNDTLDLYEALHHYIHDTDPSIPFEETTQKLFHLGRLYEHILDWTQTRTKLTHYTHDEALYHIVQHTIQPYLRASPKSLPTLCDPTMGTGLFLLAACESLHHHFGEIEKGRLIASAYGVDIDPISVEISRFSVWYWAGQQSEQWAQVTKNIRHGDALFGVPFEQEKRKQPKTWQQADNTIHKALYGHERETQFSLFGDTEQIDECYFHWPLAFPEIQEQRHPGFDIIVGNPPFLGGQKVSGWLGKERREYLVNQLAGGQKGSADLACYFLLRSAQLLNRNGWMGLILTDTIAQGDTREVGLDRLLSTQWKIYKADTHKTWPGQAAVRISLLWMTQRDVHGAKELNGQEVEHIDSYLRASSHRSAPDTLQQNQGITFIGSQLSGEGFKLPPELAQEWIQEDPQYRDILFPILRGADVNKHPRHLAKQWVIHFGERSYEEAAQHTKAMEWVRKHVKPKRDKLKRKIRREQWWLFAERCVQLYEQITDKQQVFVQPFTTKYINPVRVDAAQVFSAPMVVFTRDDWGFYACIQSTLHDLWTHWYSSTMTGGRRYTPSDCFETFPFPDETTSLDQIGEMYHTYRDTLQQQREIGLTSIYNDFHAPDCKESQWLRLRELQQKLDTQVLKAYGWDDLHITYEFVERSYGTRRTFAASLREQIHQRLYQRNQMLAAKIE